MTREQLHQLAKEWLRKSKVYEKAGHANFNPASEYICGRCHGCMVAFRLCAKQLKKLIKV